VTGLNSVECEIGKECGSQVIGGDYDDEDDDTNQTRPWDKISLTITSLDLQGEDVCEVVFCLLDDLERVQRIQKEAQIEAANEREAAIAATTSLSMQQSQSCGVTPTPEPDFEQENTPPVPTVMVNTNTVAISKKFTLQNFLRELLFPRRGIATPDSDLLPTTGANSSNKKAPTIVISPSSPLPMHVNSIQSPGVCYSTVNTKCCVLPFLSNSD